MSFKLFNPPPALLSSGNKEGVEIGGALSIIAMDADHNLHIVENLISELSWGKFWKEEDISDQIETIEVKHEDNIALFDPQELIKRLVNGFAKIRVNKWILFGISSFESNSFESEMCLEGLDYSYIERLMAQHKMVRDQEQFPALMDTRTNGYIHTKFNGKSLKYFYFPPEDDLFMIFGKLKPLTGSATGIVCTSQGAANFYLLSENINTIKSGYRIDTETLEKAFSLMKKKIIFPLSWFKMDLGLASLKALDQWNEIKNSNVLKKALLGYFQYIKTDLKNIHDRKQAEKKKNAVDEATPVDIGKMSKSEKQKDMDSIEGILNMGDLGLFKKEIQDNNE
ncbi:MAG: hypothetical protein GY870_01420 [archaeon]|nr:hypothetical protein [archaeon]